MPVPVPPNSNRAGKTKTVDLTKDIKILRTRSDFDKFVTSQKVGATQETLDDLNALHESVFSSKLSNVNKTKPIKDFVKKKITVPPTVLHKDESAITYPFSIPPKYIRYIQNRNSVNGIKLSDTVIIHYNLAKDDHVFVGNLNQRSTDIQLTMVSFFIKLSENEFLLLMDIFEKTSTQCRYNQLSYELALLVARNHNIVVPAYILREVHAYWIRRRVDNGLPLVRHLWPQTNANDASPFALFRPRAKDKMLLRKPRRTQLETLQRLYHVIDGFKRVLKLLMKMKQRDEKKLILAELELILLDQRHNENLDNNYSSPFWHCIVDIKRSRAIKKRRIKDDSSSNNAQSVRALDDIQGAKKGLGLPEAENYNRMRLSRRIGRGGRVWIDRRHLYNQDNEWKEEDEIQITQQVDTAFEPNKFDTRTIYNKNILNTLPGFANPYEAGHPYNTIGFSMYSMPGYLRRQLYVLNMLDNMSLPESVKVYGKQD